MDRLASDTAYPHLHAVMSVHVPLAKKKYALITINDVVIFCIFLCYQIAYEIMFQT